MLAFEALIFHLEKFHWNGFCNESRWTLNKSAKEGKKTTLQLHKYESVATPNLVIKASSLRGATVA